MLSLRTALGFLAFALASVVFAEDDAPYRLPLSLPLLDWTYQQSAPGFSPSLMQSQALTVDFYRSTHGLIARGFSTEQEAHPHPLELWTLLAFDYLTMNMPLTLTWLHEEAHRAVLSHRGMASHNGVYNFQSDDDVPVDRVLDRDLSRLKSRYPADFVRLSTAGMESESQLALVLEKEQFFHKALPREGFLLLLSHLSPIGYRSFCDSSSGDQATVEDLAAEGPDEMDRDFTGYDCVAYVYDLFRPHEAYEARGTHPSGVGVKRYRSRQDLTQTEKKYLTRMASLSWLNLVDPFLIHFSGWESGDYRWTATLRHHLAPFGHSLEENIFLRGPESRHLIILRQYRNQTKTMPGIEWQCFSCYSTSSAWQWDLRAALWMQPDSLLFASQSWQPGGSMALRLNQRLSDTAYGFAELQTKTRGWLADEVALEPSTNLRLGLGWSWP